MTATRTICHHCVHEPYLRREIADQGSESVCSYCGHRANAYELTTLADRVETAFGQHYERTPPDEASDDGWAGPASEWGRSGFPVVDAIANAADIPRRAAADVQRLLEARHDDKHAERAGEETEFCSEAYYDERDVDARHWHELWDQFERTIKTQTRFFGHHAGGLLAAAFAGIDDIGVISAGERQSLVIDIGPTCRLKALYRARAFQSEDALREALCRPDHLLGPPPGQIAPPGRMNASGISVFYGATDRDTAIAEVRPPVRSLVAIARFHIVRPLRILSLGNLAFADAPGSIFDEAHAPLRQRAAFLQALSDYLCEPVVPEAQPVDYLLSQAVADFLATENDPRLDGVAYPTTQILGSGSNVALFHKAARVEERRLSQGTTIEATGPVDEEGLYTGFEITERRAADPREAKRDQRAEDPPPWEQTDQREPALRVDVQSIQVREVTGVEVSTHAHEITRRRAPF